MALEKLNVVDKIEVVGQWKYVQVRTAERIVEDGKVIAQSFHRKFISPGQDVSEEDSQVQAIVAAVHTPELLSDYQEYVAQNTDAQQSEMGEEAE